MPTITVPELRGETMEALINLKDATSLFPKTSRGHSPRKNTLNRWAISGVRLAGGRRVRLACVRIGSTLFTSQAAIDLFVQKLNPEYGEA